MKKGKQGKTNVNQKKKEKIVIGGKKGIKMEKQE